MLICFFSTSLARCARTNNGKCVILVSHSPDVARMCDETYELTKITGKNKKK